MKIYFLSSQPALLTLNGAYFGITDRFERFAELSLADRIYAEFSAENALSVGFFLTEKLLTQPPNGCEVYLLNDGVAVYAKDFPPADHTLRPITQARFGELLASVYQQGYIQLSLQTPTEFFVAPLPPSFADCKLIFEENLLFIEGKNTLAIYTKAGKRVFFEEILSYFVENGELNATLPLSDRLGRTAECAYRLSENSCERIRFSIRQTRAQDGSSEREQIAKELLPYAFFESLFIGAEYADFLCDELAPNAEKLVGFLGDFIDVVLTDEPSICGLVREKAPRLFEVDYYKVEIKQGKITDVQELPRRFG